MEIIQKKMVIYDILYLLIDLLFYGNIYILFIFGYIIIYFIFE